jgi:PT repeat
MSAPPRPIQRVGHIGDVDNRFCGAAVFGALAERVADPTELLCCGFGMPPPDRHGREVLRCIALCVTSPDARVWPLKLTRVLSSYGNSFAGFFGAQLANFSERMGPNTAAHAAASLRWIAEGAGAPTGAPTDEPTGEPTDAPTGAPTDEQVSARVAEHLACRGRIAGFGVPFRKEDERLLALHRLLSGHPAQRGAMWRLHLQVVTAMRRLEGLEPNIAFPLAALFTDLGLAAHRAGLFLSLLMSPVFAAHALEAADRDAALLQQLEPRFVEDRSPAPRRSPRALARATPR